MTVFLCVKSVCLRISFVSLNCSTSVCVIRDLYEIWKPGLQSPHSESLFYGLPGEGSSEECSSTI